MKEVWKDIEELNCLYQISSLGRVRSKDRVIEKSNGYTHTHKGKVLRPAVSKKGYLTCSASIMGQQKTVKPHRLVALYFVSNEDNKPHVNHINGIKTDNRIENLEWVTNHENILHAWKTGLNKPKKGVSHPRASISANDAKRVKDLRAKGFGRKDIQKATGVNQNIVDNIIYNNSWSHL